MEAVPNNKEGHEMNVLHRHKDVNSYGGIGTQVDSTKNHIDKNHHSDHSDLMVSMDYLGKGFQADSNSTKNNTKNDKKSDLQVNTYDLTAADPRLRYPRLDSADGDNDDNGHDENYDGGGHDEGDAHTNKRHQPRVPVTFRTQMLSMVFLLVIILTPIVLLPIIMCVDESFEKEARCGYVIAIMAVFWTTEVMPISITALLPVVLLPMLGVLTARETSAAFFNDTSMLFVGGLLVAIAIEVWNVHKRIALMTVRFVGAEPKFLLLGLSLVTWFLSMWVSNTATTAMMMTIVTALLDQYRDIYKRRDVRQSRHRSHPDGLSKMSEIEYLRLCKAASLTVAYAANIGGVGSLTGTGPNIIFYAAAQELFESKHVKNPVTFGTWMAYGVPLSLLLVVLMWVWMVMFFLRCRGSWPMCKKIDGEDEEERMISEVIEQEYVKLGPVSYAQKTIFVMFILMVVCWISRDLGMGGGWGSLFLPRMVSDSTPSILFGILMFVVPAVPPRICGKGGNNGHYVKVKPLLQWQDVHEKMPWSLYLILGGGYALAKASTTSGLSAWLGVQLMVFRELNNWVILLILCFVVAFVTEVTSNSATATLLMPILSQMAISLQVNPLFFMYPAAIATSFAFMLPAATPPNAIVFSRGNVRVIDMVSCGFILNVISVPILVMATATWGNALFHFDTMPPEFLTNGTQS